jgi:transposase-like protein
MAKKNPKSTILKELRSAVHGEQAAVEFLEKHRWGSSPACPRCGDTDVYRMMNRDAPGLREENLRWRCRGCKKMYSVRTGLVLEESRLPVRVWVYAFWKASASKKGVSALQISRECEISYKSALFLMHRIRYAMLEDTTGSPKLSGTVEVDETYVGGKPRFRMPARDPKTGQPVEGRQTLAALEAMKPKAPVMALVERGGRVRVRHIERVDRETLGAAVREMVEAGSTLYTDENPSYQHLGEKFRHATVKHSAREYARGDVSTNTVEGFFSLLKRGVYGTFHSVSKHHLHRYLAEFEFRYNHRKIDDGARTLAAIRGAEGKRLLYKKPAATA